MKRHGPFLIIANPTSGRGRGRRTSVTVAQRLRAAGYEVEVFYTHERGDAEQISREAATRPANPPRCIVACGGDGTVQEVANALASLKQKLEDRCPFMGLAPAGRCNDFARAVGISKDPSAITAVLLDGMPQALDLGRVNGRYFCTVATVGADAEVSNFVDAMRIPLRGTSAYLYGALCVLPFYHPLHPRIEGDFGTIDRPVFVASTANTAMYGGRIRIAPDAVATDGQLNLCLIDAVSLWRIFTLLPQVLLGRHRNQPEVQFFRTRRLRITTALPATLWADGERVATTPAELEVVPDAVRVMVPSDFAKSKPP